MMFKSLDDDELPARFRSERRGRNDSFSPRMGVDITEPYDSIDLMTPTATQMKDSYPPMYRLVVRTLEKGLADVETFRETTPYVVSSSRRIEEVSKNYLADPTVQVRVESNNVIVAVGLYGQLLWLDKVPPPRYWRKMPPKPPARPERTGNERMAACGLPIPDRYREPICNS